MESLQTSHIPIPTSTDNALTNIHHQTANRPEAGPETTAADQVHAIPGTIQPLVEQPDIKPEDQTVTTGSEGISAPAVANTEVYKGLEDVSDGEEGSKMGRDSILETSSDRKPSDTDDDSEEDTDDDEDSDGSDDITFAEPSIEIDGQGETEGQTSAGDVGEFQLGNSKGAGSNLNMSQSSIGAVDPEIFDNELENDGVGNNDDEDDAHVPMIQQTSISRRKAIKRAPEGVYIGERNLRSRRTRAYKRIRASILDLEDDNYEDNYIDVRIL